MLLAVQVTISLGIDAIPLDCVTAGGYLAHLLLWVLIPIILIIAITLIESARLIRRSRFSMPALMQAVAPLALRIIFLCYPTITNISFEAFSCYAFDDGTRWLISDVSIQCDTAQHRHAKASAWAAIAVYPAGCILLNSYLLLMARNDIHAARLTRRTRAIAFLYQEYVPSWYAWELAEMSRRFVLVGLLVVTPFERGSIMQLALATALCFIYTVAQVLASPFRNTTDNFVALNLSVSLAFLFLCCSFFKFATITELESVQAQLSIEQNTDFVLPNGLLVFCLICCLFGTWVLTACILIVHMARWGPRPVLHWKERGVLVESLMLQSNDHFHIFISFVFRSGLQQAMAIKSMLQTALPGLRCFFAVDDLSDISQLEEIQRNRVGCMVSLLTGHVDHTGEHSHYFHSEREPNGSKYCTKELELMLLELKRPVVCLLETLHMQGGVALSTHHHACPNHLLAAFEACHIVPFHREPGLKQATIRLVLEDLLPCIANDVSGLPGQVGQQLVYLPDEITRQPLSLPPPVRIFHIYISTSNSGAQELVQLLQAEQKSCSKERLLVATDSLARADFWLLYLSRYADPAG